MSAIADEVLNGNSVHQEAVNTILAIWKNVLSKNDVGPVEDFFDLGGNSMLLLSMLEIVQEKFERVVSMDDLSEGVTVERIATLVTAKA
ncbi:MAG: acyl carrier protein [Sulfurifustaceae bacterium]